MDTSRFRELYETYYHGTATLEEIQEFATLVGSQEYRELSLKLIQQSWEAIPHDVRVFDASAEKRVMHHILGSSTEKPVHNVYWFKAISSAAAVLILVLIGIYYFRSITKTPQEIAVVSKDIAPGHAGAIVTLSNGRKIALDTAKDGLLAMDGTVQVIKENGQIRYEGQNIATLYNETATDHGRSWPVELPDGSIAWLNTSSSIRYPISFSGSERKVTMAGECFFEVKHDATKPFRVVLADGQIIEDVGTAFNVRTYADEAIQKTTVTEGSIDLKSRTTSYRVAAGRQAEIQGGAVLRVTEAQNLDEIIAWKDNRFRFRGATVKTILTEAARWYDMELVFKDDIRDTYTLSMSRDIPLSKLLSNLEQSGGVHFTIEGKRVIVTR